MTKEFTKHCGDLPTDSPGLWRTLAHILSKEELCSMQRIYAEAAKNGALNDFPIKREPGVNYNPHPARLCQILIAELKETRYEALAAAVNYCTKDSPQINNNPQIREAITLAHTLDTLRHLHMSTLNTKEKEQIYNHTKDQLIPSITHPENERLKILLTTCIERYKRSQQT